ncbi:MAG: glycosyltransferase [Nanoarchaeota archaeon]|nr:glycosyltransferase [Nanoarchaeota archaeon]
MPKASIVMIAHNEAQFISESIRCIQSQTEKDFELIIVDDASTDATIERVAGFRDRRIRYFRNARNMGAVYSRNKGIDKARSNFIFFIDGDCYADKSWLASGLAAFGDNIGVEGKIILSSPSNSISDKIVENLHGHQYMTGNMAYRKDALLEAGMFSSDFKEYYEDRELAIRMMLKGSIVFSESMCVRHQLKKWGIRAFLRNARKVKGLVLLYKVYGWKHYMFRFVVKPKDLLLVLFPPLMILLFVNGRIKKKRDLIFIPLYYMRAVYMRLLIWKAAFDNKVFLV